jgi:hypothetical protein
MARTPWSCARNSAISSRSAKHKYLPDKGVSWIEGIPPPSRNQREPTGPDVPQAIAACSLDSPSAILTQNARSTSRRTGGRPGDRIAGRPVNVTIHPGGRPIQHLQLEVLRRPLDSAQYTAISFTEALIDAGIAPSIGTVGDALDNALIESAIGLYKTELIEHPDRTRAWSGRAEVERETAAWVHWYNTTRIHHSLAKTSPIEFEEHYRLANPARTDEVA